MSLISTANGESAAVRIRVASATVIVISLGYKTSELAGARFDPRISVQVAQLYIISWSFEDRFGAEVKGLRSLEKVPTMKLSMQLNYAGSFLDVVGQVQAYEAAGLDVVWVAEAYGFDSVSLMGFLAAKTNSVLIGSAILPIYTRTPALLAQTAAGLDEVSSGRAILGLGASGPQVIEGWHGVAYDRPLQRTREIISICRRVWLKERLTNSGIYEIPLPPEEGTGLGKPLKMITNPRRATIPIFVASLGPKNVEMTAELADGWLPIFFVPSRAHEVWGTSLAAGMARRDPGLGRLDIVAGGLLAIGDDVDHLLDLGRASMALYIGGMGAKGRNFYNDLAKRYGYEKEADRIQDLYLEGKKKEAMAEVPIDFLRQTSLIGSKEYVRDRIAEFEAAGVTMLSVIPVGDDPMGSFRTVRDLTA